MDIFQAENRAPKDIAEWTAEDLTPFRCPEALERCIVSTKKGSTYVAHFFYSVEIRMEVIKHEDSSLIITLLPDPERYKSRPLAASQAAIQTTDFISRENALSKFDFVIQLNSHLLSMAYGLRIGDGSLIYDGSGKIIDNPQSPGRALERARQGLPFGPAPKKRWWNL